MSENTRKNGNYSKRGNSSGWQSAGQSYNSRSRSQNKQQRNQFGEKSYGASGGKWQKSNRHRSDSNGHRWENRDSQKSGARFEYRRDKDTRHDGLSYSNRRNDNRSSGRRWESHDDYRKPRGNKDEFRAPDNRSRNNGNFRRGDSAFEDRNRRNNSRDNRRHDWDANNQRNDRDSYFHGGSERDSRWQGKSDRRSTRNIQGQDQRIHNTDASTPQRRQRGGERFGVNYRDSRDKRSELINEIPASITADSLDPATRAHLRNLNRENSEIVARHLAYAGEMVDIDPEVAYRHAKAAFARAARIDVVREALGITAYLTGRYQEALSELRTYRRMSNDFTHVAMEADAERGMGRSEKALKFIAEIPLSQLDPAAKIELALVTSGARADVGDSAGGLAVVEKIIVKNLDDDLAARVELVHADRLAELGRETEAQVLRAKWNPIFEGDADEAVVLDLEEVFADEDFSEDMRKSGQTERAEQARRDDADEVAEIDTAAFDELFAEIEVDSQVAAEFTAELAADAIAERDAQNVQSEPAADAQKDLVRETADNASAPVDTNIADANLSEITAGNTDLGEPAAEESAVEEPAAPAESAVETQEAENAVSDDTEFVAETTLKAAPENASVAERSENEETILDGAESVAGEDRFADLKKTLKRLNIELADDVFSADEFDNDDDFFDDDFDEDDLDFADDDIDWDAEFTDDDFSDHFFDDDADYDR